MGLSPARSWGCSPAVDVAEASATGSITRPGPYKPPNGQELRDDRAHRVPFGVELSSAARPRARARPEHVCSCCFRRRRFGHGQLGVGGLDLPGRGRLARVAVILRALPSSSLTHSQTKQLWTTACAAPLTVPVSPVGPVDGAEEPREATTLSRDQEAGLSHSHPDSSIRAHVNPALLDGAGLT